MALTPAERISQLEAAVQPITAEDLMVEAGRKVLLGEFISMLKHEDGSRNGLDVEDVHDMRVAIRRMRSVFRLLKPFFKKNAARHHNEELRRLAWALGSVRDYDVLIDNLAAFQTTLEADAQANLQAVIDDLDTRRSEARETLNSLFDSKAYRRFVKEFSAFLTKPGEGAKATASESVTPSQVRHVLPGMIYNHLASVRAYATVVGDADATTLHALRIEFKRLRYTVSLFDGLLGSQAKEFISEIKELQDCLGHLNDATTARMHLEAYTHDVVSTYIAHLESHEADLKIRFDELWSRFNTRKVQQKISTAVLALN